MDDRQFFSMLSSRLVRSLPRAYASRVLQELMDHAQDSERPAAETLGEPVVIADGVLDGFRRRSVVGRHPVISMLAVPMLGSFAIAFAFAVICVFVTFLIRPDTGFGLVNPNAPGSVGFRIAQTAVSLLTILPFALATYVTSRVWRLAGRDWRWFAGALCVHVFAATIIVGDVDISRPSVTLSAPCDHPFSEPISAWMMVPQILLPVLVGALILLRRHGKKTITAA